SSEAIDEDTTGVKIARNLAGDVDVFCPDIAAQTELTGVCRADGGIEVWDTSYRGNGTERFFIESGHPFGYSAQHGRRIESALAFDWFAAAQQAGAFCDTAFHLLVQRVAQVGTGHGSESGRGMEGVANTKCFCRLDKQLFEFIGDFLNKNEAFRSQANLTCVMEPALDTSLDSLWYVSILADDECIGPAQLHHGLLDDFSGFGSDCGTCPHAAGYGSTLNARIVDNVDDVVSLENQILKDTFRESGFQHNALELERTSLSVRRVLHQDDIPGEHRRDGHAGELPDGKIPRHDGEDCPDGKIGHVSIDDPCCSLFVGHGLWSLLGVPIRFMSALLDLGLSLGEDLSHRRCDDLRELGLVFSQGARQARKELGSFVNR